VASRKLCWFTAANSREGERGVGVVWKGGGGPDPVWPEGSGEGSG